MEPNDNFPPPSQLPDPSPQQPLHNPIQPNTWFQPSQTPFKSSIKPKKRKAMVVLMALVLLLAAGGGAATAYYGYILPNQPGNRLLSALTNAASQHQVTAKGTIDATFDNTDFSGLKGMAIDYSIMADADKNAFSMSADIGLAGSKLPVELRYVDKDIFFKISGIKSLASLVPATSSDLITPYLDWLAKADSQWYEIDRSFLQETGTDSTCVTDLSFSLTQNDLALLKKAYKKHPLFKVKSTAKVKISGVQTTKLELDPASDAEATKFAEDLSTLSVVKNVKSCLKSTGVKDTFDTAINPSKNTSTGSIFVYITDKNQLKKIEINVKEGSSTTELSSEFDFTVSNIEKPADAKPLQDLVGSLFGDIISSYGDAGGTFTVPELQ